MSISRSGEQRRIETPNAVMTTLAAASTGAAELAVWRVSMCAGQAGPDHEMSREQVWTVLHGELTVETPAGAVSLAAGDAVALPGDMRRRIVARTDAEALVASGQGGVATAAGREPAVPPWAI